MGAKVIVITGGIGAGKSVVSAMLAARDIPVYDSDNRAKNLYDSDRELAEGVRRLFGDVVFKDGCIDKSSLAGIVFSDESSLRALEAMVHPAVYRDFAAWKASHDDLPLVGYESAIALDKGLPEGFADFVIYVDAPQSLRLSRAVLRDTQQGRGVDSDASSRIEKRMNYQTAGPEHPLVDYVIENDSDIDDLEQAVDAVLGKIGERIV